MPITIATQSTKNPHSIFNAPRQWLRWRRVRALHRAYSLTRVELNDHEQRLLIPQLQSRASYMIELFQKVKTINQNINTRNYIAPAIHALLQPSTDPDAGTRTAEDFFNGLTKMVDDSFINPLQKLKQNYPSIDSLDTLYSFANDLLFICMTVTSNEKYLFHYRIKTGLLAADTSTGHAIYDEPKELAFTLSPFKHLLDEITTSAKSTEGTLRNWREQNEKSQEKFLDLLIAENSTRTGRFSTWTQITAVVLTVALSYFFLVAQDPLSLFKRNRTLQERTIELESVIAKKTEEFDNIRLENERLRLENEQLKKEHQ